MNDKPIIIDGINVSECRLRVYNSDLCNGFKLDNSGFHQGHCRQNPNCYYKQLKRLQAENERLKEEIKDLKFYIDSYRQVWELDKYKQALEDVREVLCQGRTFYEGYFDNPDNLSRVDKAIFIINEVLK